MATAIAPEGVPPELVNARRTESIDAPQILSLVADSTNALFGRVNVVNIIEKAVLAITLCNDKDEILGHAAFFDYPNVADVDQANWQEWLNTYYDTTKCTPLNSLFMHYFVAKKAYARECALEIVRTAFNAVPNVHFLYLVVPKGLYPESYLADIFKPLNPLTNKSPSTCAVFLCGRHEHFPVVHVRQARVEDHDDLTPIFNRQSDMLKMTYGDHFLAELIEAQDDHMHCLVAEIGGTAFGFMSISDDVNYSLLNECFELVPLHGLRKPNINDVLEPDKPDTPIMHDDEVRPASINSCKSGTSAKGGKAADSLKDAGTEAVNSKHSSGRSSRANSASKVNPKLSGTMLGDSTTNLLDDELSSDRSTPIFGDTVPINKPVSLVPRYHKRFVPKFLGEPNAFSIQLFCIDERYEMRSCDFLPLAFQKFPDREFCIVTVPHLVPEFPLLQSFVRVTPRCPSILSQELYVFHRNGLLKDFSVRFAEPTDYTSVEKLTKNIELHENLLKDLVQYNMAKRDNDGTEIQAFVAESQKQVVAIAIIRVEEDIEYIRSHYNIEDFIYYNHHKRAEHGRIHHFTINPMFMHLSKHFLKEILRIGHKTCLYYPLYPPYSDPEIVNNFTLISCLKEMVPIRHRRQIIYPLEQLGINAPSDRVLAVREPYALNHINRKLTLEPKVTINARIVVVGASNVGIAFLEALAYCPHLHFNNLTLISPHGLPGDLPTNELQKMMLSTSHCYNQEDYAKMALRAWVNVVHGKMTGIDRKKKFVKVDGDMNVPYDHLVLCTGQQYQLPMPTEADVENGATNANLPNRPDRRFIGTQPRNLFTINDAYDAAVAVNWIENHLIKHQRKAIVYGSTLDAYTCVQTLLSMGLAGDKVIMVQPPPNDKVSCFNDPVVEETMLKTLQECGVQMHVGYILAQWNNFGMEGIEIKTVSFTSDDQPLTVECSAFFSFIRKGVDFDAFSAINNACIVYDGKLAIDAYFHTNDVAIRSAGPMTKFQRKYHADKWSHACFNSKEVGMALATEMLRLFDPTLEQQAAPQEEQMNLIPIYRSPKIQGALLPGNYYYLHLKKPNLDKPLIEQMGQADYGRILQTGSPGTDKEYFRLHINLYQSVETMTCLSKKPLPNSNLICLYGLHERCLNNLVSRFDEGLVQDLYNYFSETWALALYHDRFADFREELRELLTTRPMDGAESLEERVRNLTDPEVPLTEKQRENLTDLYQQTGAKRAVEARLLNFLSYNSYHLPMYAKPGMV